MAKPGAEQLAARVNADQAFVRAARWMHGEVTLEPSPLSGEAVTLQVFEGQVAITENTGPYAVRLQAPEGWRRLAARGGLQRGFRHGYVAMAGDTVTGMRNWVALARLVDVVAQEW